MMLKPVGIGRNAQLVAVVTTHLLVIGEQSLKQAQKMALRIATYGREQVAETEPSRRWPAAPALVRG